MALLVVVAGLLTGCRSRSTVTDGQAPRVQPTTSSAVQTSPPAAPTSSTPPPARPSPKPLPRAGHGSAPVHMSFAFDDGNTYGVGIPVIALFSAQFTDASALQAATTVTVNGVRVSGAHWYFVTTGSSDSPIAGHLRLRTYWPAHARIHISVAARGLSAGTGFGFDDSASFDFTTGAAQLMTVDGVKHTLTLTVDGKRRGVYPIALGKPGHATQTGVKVVMEHLSDVEMKGQGYDVPDVQWDERLTYAGEYLHAAPWNIWNIEHGVDSSHGCTNLRPDDAHQLYLTLRVGDVVNYVHVQEGDSTPMTMGDGWGDWNVAWPTWLSGGAVPVHSLS